MTFSLNVFAFKVFWGLMGLDLWLDSLWDRAGSQCSSVVFYLIFLKWALMVLFLTMGDYLNLFVFL